MFVSRSAQDAVVLATATQACLGIALLASLEEVRDAAVQVVPLSD